jgi:hypothetical protein
VTTIMITMEIDAKQLRTLADIVHRSAHFGWGYAAFVSIKPKEAGTG